MLFINAADHFVKGKRQNQLSEDHIQKIVSTYQNRDEHERYSRRVAMKEIVDNDYNLNVSRYVSTAEAAKNIALDAVHAELEAIASEIDRTKMRHNAFFAELGLAPLPSFDALTIRAGPEFQGATEATSRGACASGKCAGSSAQAPLRHNPTPGCHTRRPPYSASGFRYCLAPASAGNSRPLLR